MPKYDYRCRDCGSVAELDYSLNSELPDVLICLNDHHDNGFQEHLMTRLYHPVAFTFKGSGFYSTDSRKPTHVKKSLTVGGDN